VQNRLHLIISLVFGLVSSLLFAADAEKPTETSTASLTTDVETETPTINPILKKQQQLVSQLEAKQSEQDAVWLKTTQGESLALFRQDETGQRLGTVILIPDLGAEVGQPGLINYLAKSLTTKGWSTLNIAITDSQNSADSKGSELITAAINSAQSQQNGDIYLILLGRHQATYSNLPQTTKGLILINLPTNRNTNLPDLLTSSTVPMLDIIGTRDHFMKKPSWIRRKNLAKSANLEYRQLVFEGVDREFSGIEKSLSRVISAWLKKQGDEE